MRKVLVLPLFAAITLVLLSGPSDAALAGQFCKKTAVGQTTTASNGATVTCTHVNGYNRWVAASSTPLPATRPPAAPPTTAPPTTTPPAAHIPTQAQKNSVGRLYRAYFLRDSDSGGLKYWADQSANGKKLASISDYFARSAEFRTRYGSLSNAAFVDLIYSNLFDRQPDDSGRVHWTGVLDGGKNRGDVMIGFSESSEYRRVSGIS